MYEVYPVVTVVLLALSPLAAVVAAWLQSRFELFEYVGSGSYSYRIRAAVAWGGVVFVVGLLSAVAWPVALPFLLVMFLVWVAARVGAHK